MHQEYSFGKITAGLAVGALLATSVAAGSWKRDFQAGRRAFLAGRPSEAASALLASWRGLSARGRTSRVGLKVLSSLDKSFVAAGRPEAARKVRRKSHKLAAHLFGADHPKVLAMAATLAPEDAAAPAAPAPSTPAVVAPVASAQPSRAVPSAAALDEAAAALNDPDGQDGWASALATVRAGAAGEVAAAARTLGLAFRLGRGVIQDHTEANRWFYRAAAAGDAAASFHLGMASHRGLGRPADYQAAVEAYQVAAAAGFAPAQANLGELMLASENRAVNQMGVRWIGVAAQADFAPALGRLADLYREGFRSVVIADPRRAMGLYEAAARAGLARAHYNLGVFYETGFAGTSPDQAASDRHYRQAAAMGFQGGNV